MPSTAYFRNDIQGLRGIAVLLVVAFHAGYELVPGGFVGVDVFFVISGYLITGLLLREFDKTESISFLNFYARRMRRLLPAAVLVLLVTLALAYQIYAPLQIENYAATAVTVALYVGNLWFAHTATDYLAQSADTNPFLHTWSLAVEEQFYLVWPVLIFLSILAGRKYGLNKALLFSMLAIIAASLASSVYLTSTNQPWAFFSSPTRAWEFGAGALVALWIPSQKFGDSAKTGLALGAIGVVLIIYSVVVIDRYTAFPGFAAVLPVLGAMFVIAAGHRSNQIPVINQLLARHPIRFIGDISYSLYLWHWPVFIYLQVLLGEIDQTWRAVGILISVVLAWLTYVIVENPIRFSARLGVTAEATIVMGLLLTLTAAGSALLLRQASVESLNTVEQRRYLEASTDIPVVYADDCHLDFLESDVRLCSYGSKNPSKEIVIFGDSHAAQWFPALEEIASQNGWRLRSLTKSACPSVSFLIYLDQLRRIYYECENWRKNVLADLAEHPPSLVIISNSSAAAFGRSLQPTDDQLALWEQGLRQSLRNIAGSGIEVVILGDTPWLPHRVPECMSHAEWQNRDPALDCEFSTENAVSREVLAIETAVAREFNSVRYIDMTSSICENSPCGVEKDGMIAFRDADHMTATFARSLAKVLSAKLDYSFISD